MKEAAVPLVDFDLSAAAAAMALFFFYFCFLGVRGGNCEWIKIVKYRERGLLIREIQRRGKWRHGFERGRRM